MSALCQCSFLLLQANLALHLTSLLVSLWCPGPSPPVIFRVEVLLCLVALVFFFIQLGQRVLQFALMDPSRSGLASTTPPFSKLPACLGHRQADVSDFALNSSSKSNLSENVPYLLYFHQALERDSREKWSWNDNPGPQIFSLSPAAAPAAQSVSPEPGRPIRGSIHGNIKLWHIL